VFRLLQAHRLALLTVGLLRFRERIVSRSSWRSAAGSVCWSERESRYLSLDACFFCRLSSLHAFCRGIVASHMTTIPKRRRTGSQCSRRTNTPDCPNRQSHLHHQSAPLCCSLRCWHSQPASSFLGERSTLFAVMAHRRQLASILVRTGAWCGDASLEQ
jgi:hypothetical protein